MSGYRYTGIQVTGNRQSVLQVTGKSTQAHLDRFCIDFGLDEPVMRTPWIHMLSYRLTACHLSPALVTVPTAVSYTHLTLPTSDLV